MLKHGKRTKPQFKQQMIEIGKLKVLNNEISSYIQRLRQIQQAAKNDIQNPYFIDDEREEEFKTLASKVIQRLNAPTVEINEGIFCADEKAYIELERNTIAGSRARFLSNRIKDIEADCARRNITGSGAMMGLVWTACVESIEGLLNDYLELLETVVRSRQNILADQEYERQEEAIKDMIVGRFEAIDGMYRRTFKRRGIDPIPMNHNLDEARLLSSVKNRINKIKLARRLGIAKENASSEPG